MDNLKKILDEIIEDKIKNNMKIEAGNNGPYNNEENNARNKAHWIGILKYKYNTTKMDKYKNFIIELADSLCSMISDNGAIKCFLNNPVIETNGVIGQAWVIEGLINAYEVARDDKYIVTAKKIFLSQEYNRKKHLWTVVNCSKEKIDTDYVFNHQLWFAASGYMILKNNFDEEISNELTDFTKNIEKLYECYSNGLLKHVAIVGNDLKSRTKKIIKRILKDIKYIGKSLEKKEVEKGYHLFDLYGFALLYTYSNNSLNINTKKFQSILNYGLNVKENNELLQKYYNDFTMNKYAYPYNSPAFEFPYIDYIFNQEKNKNYYEDLIEYQIEKFYDSETKSFSKNTNDSNTLTARIYELCRYLELSETNGE